MIDFLLTDPPAGLHQEVEAVERLAPGLGSQSRERGPAEQTQRLDAGQGGGTEAQQDSQTDPLRPQQNSLPDLHQVQGWGDRQLELSPQSYSYL